MSDPARKPRHPKTVGFWMDLESSSWLELAMYAGCQKHAREAGWRLVLDPSVNRLHRWRPGRPHYDGILARATREMAEAAHKTGVPLVNLCPNSPVVENLPSVVPDGGAAGILAAEHLAGRGLRSFGYLGPRRQRDADQQFGGFRDTLAGQGFECMPFHYPRTLLAGRARLWEKFAVGMHQWLASLRPPAGIFVHQDLVCRLLIDFCSARGLSVPGDVAITGCFNDEIICMASGPSLTSIDMGYECIGHRAAKLLDDLISGKVPPRGRVVRVPPTRLVTRESSDIFASSDPLVARAMRYIASHNVQFPDVPDIVSEIGVSRRTLERRFQKAVGRSIAGETLRLRLNRAKRRLASGDVLLKTVAREAGFRTASHFSRVFTRATGVTPSQYRAERQVGT